MVRSLISAFFVISLFSDSIYAHGTSIYVSTPVSAPNNYGWVVLISTFILIVTHAILFRKFLKLSWFLAISGSVIAIIVLWLAYWFMVGLAGPLPIPQGERRIFWGYGWRHVGIRFFCSNLLGIFLLGAGIWITSNILKKYQRSEGRKRWRLYAFSAGIYILCLCPYIFSGALTRGGHGGYTHMACGSRICELGLALQKYADEHSGLLPIGKDFAEIMPQLRPYVWTGLRLRMPIQICPVGGSYEKDPKPYMWNSQMSGKSLDELKQLEKPEWLLRCPYEHWPFKVQGDAILYTYHILYRDPNVLQERGLMSLEEFLRLQKK
jgi:hypothetical protein